MQESKISSVRHFPLSGLSKGKNDTIVHQVPRWFLNHMLYNRQQSTNPQNSEENIKHNQPTIGKKVSSETLKEVETRIRS